MVGIPKGGRGHKAPYDTCTVRIPVAIREQVDALAEEYKLSVLQGNDADLSKNTHDLDSAVEIAKKFLKQKRSAKQTIINLLQVLYNTKISPSDFD